MPNEKDKIVNRLKRKLTENTYTPTGYLIKGMTYTGLHPNTLIALQESSELNVTVEELDRAVIYQKLCIFYLGRFKLPTTYELYDSLFQTGDMGTHMDIETFRKLLLKLDFIWKKQNDKRVVVIEKPLVRYERCNYLRQIKHERNYGYCDIYYVDEKAFNCVMYMDMNTSREFEKLSRGGWQQRVIYAVGREQVKCLKEIKEFCASEFEDWLLSDLCPSLANASLIVVQDLEHHNAKLLETPTLYDTKSEMIAWLDYHRVPYDDQMSKFELYKLIEEFTDLDGPLYKIDCMLKARGHTVLRIPRSISDLTPALLLHYFMEKNWNTQEYAEMIKDTAADMYKEGARLCVRSALASSSLYLGNYFTCVASKENAMYTNERNVDIVLDKLMNTDTSTVTEYLEKDDSDVVSCSDSE